MDEFSVNSENGLTSTQVKSQLLAYGPNFLASKKKETIVDIFLSQFKSPLIYILMIAAVLVLFLGDVVDALVIIVVICINSVVGTIQEGRARNSLERLKLLTRHKALVKRDGCESIVAAEELVPGDILVLHAGDRVTADARIIVAESLTVDESSLTGEAYPIAKSTGAIAKENLVIGDQKNMVFSGCGVVSGFAQAVVVATGFESSLGRISKEIAEGSNVPLPLAQKINSLSRLITFAVFGISIFLLAVGLIRGFSPREIFGVIIGLAVSVVPEGLPVAVTIVLAGGVWRMAKKRAIVRQMAAVEAMGNANLLLVDKTGTLTTGKMVISEVFFERQKLKIEGDGYAPKGKVEYPQGSRDKFLELMELCYLSTNADVFHDARNLWKASGDPTEASIAVVCRKYGLVREKLEKKYKREFVRPFDAKKRFIESVFSKDKKSFHVFIGAPDYLSRGLKVNHGFLNEYHLLAKGGLRVVGVAVFNDRKKLVSSALFAIDEELRSDAKAAISEAKLAGLRVVMLTGDFPETARAIAKKVGLITTDAEDVVIAGSELDHISEEELSRLTQKVSVFARITSGHKLIIAKHFQKGGHIVAMTGDGVNDAPALQSADLGIGLGSGTQVAKDSSDIVLVDDSFATIIDAIAEGRGIYMSLKRVVLYLLSTSLGEVLFISSAIILGLPMPLIAVQIIWLNFVTDGFLVVALAQQVPKEGMLTKEEVGTGLVDTESKIRILTMGASMLVASMFVYLVFLESNSKIYAGTMALLVLSITQWYNALNVKSRTLSIFRKPVNNNFLLAALACVFVLSILAVNTPLGNKLLHTVPVAFGDWLVAFGVSGLIILVEEVRKMFTRRTSREENAARVNLRTV